MIDLWKDHENIRAIKTMMWFAETRRHAGRSPDLFYLAAGQHLDRLARGRPQADWAALVKAECGISLSRAKELVQIGRGKSLTETRSATSRRVKKSRQNKGRS